MRRSHSGLREQQFKAGLEQPLMQDVKSWLAASWPFRKVAFPKREISQAEWDALPNKPKSPAVSVRSGISGRTAVVADWSAGC